MKFIDKIQQVLSLVVCLLILSSLAVVKQGELFGYDFKPKTEKKQIVDNDKMRTLGDGTLVVNTSDLASDIIGYGGKVPLEIYIKDNVIVDVEAKDNAETKGFFDKAKVLLEEWKGKNIDEAANMHIDAVSGATYSSKAIMGNMQRGIQYAQEQLTDGANASDDGAGGTFADFDLSVKNLIGLLVVLMAAILPFFIKDKRYRICQLVLNVVVLGFWCGAFLSYSSLIGFMSQGINILALAIPFIMLVTAFIYPLFGKKSYYCTNVCPFGSLQQIIGKCVKYKLKISQGTLHKLDIFRQILWSLLMLCIWGGVWSDWTDYEPFSAFIFQSASWITMTIAIVFVVLSFVVTRPYCRFVCPMGTLLRFSQTSKQ